jgi:hypothetical protein
MDKLYSNSLSYSFLHFARCKGNNSYTIYNIKTYNFIIKSGKVLLPHYFWKYRTQILRYTRIHVHKYWTQILRCTRIHVYKYRTQILRCTRIHVYKYRTQILRYTRIHVYKYRTQILRCTRIHVYFDKL